MSVVGTVSICHCLANSELSLRYLLVSFNNFKYFYSSS